MAATNSSFFLPHSSLNTFAFALSYLQRGQPCVLLLVVAHEGSTPGRTGFRMVVAPDGAMAGSIGGGIMEHKLVELARHQLHSSTAKVLLKRQVHRPDAPTDRSGMICAGEQTVLFFPLEPILDQPALAALVAGQQACSPGHYTLTENGLVLSKEPLLTRQSFTSPPAATGPDDVPAPGWCYAERFDPRETIHLIGAGHVGLACCELLTQLHFRICLYDNRPDLNTLAQNTFADEKIVTPYEGLGELVPGAPDHYAAVMTFGYRPDIVAVSQLLNKPLRYLGLMGSDAKIARIKAELHQQGFSDAALARLHAPIGLPINSQTPHEIAVSVAAQLIQVRHSTPC